MDKPNRKKPLKPIEKIGRKRKISIGGRKMAIDGYVRGLKLGPKGTYIYRIKVAGKVWTGDTGETRLFEAERELIKIRARYLQDSLGNEKKKAPTFAAAVAMWKSKNIDYLSKDYVENLVRMMEVHFIPYIGHRFVDKITKGDIGDCLVRYIQNTQKDKEIKNYGGHNKLIGQVHTILTLMKEEKYITDFKLPDLQKSQEVIYDVLSMEQLTKFFDETETKYGLTRTVGIALGIYLGLRASEIVNAKWEYINWDKKTFGNKKTKAKEADIIPMCDDLLSILKRHNGNQDRIGYIITNEEGKQYYRKFAEHILKSIGQEHFSKHLTAHSLRRSFITILHNAGTPPKTLQKLARHASLAQTMKYVKIGEPEKEKAIDDVFNRKSV